jgi:hypothetical protein
MNNLDSRFLSYVDRFAQVFTQPGRYLYGFAPLVLGRGNPANTPFIINVKGTPDEQREGKQHDVMVRADCGQLKAEPAELDIETNDVVCWYSCDPATPGFSVSGYSETASFNSAAMTTGAIYIHAFGIVGEFDWKDANGHPAVSGKVRVTMPPMGTPKELEAYRERLAKPTVVHISGEKAEPSDVEIVVNGVVYFVVESEDGVTITDRRLLGETTAAAPC